MYLHCFPEAIGCSGQEPKGYQPILSHTAHRIYQANYANLISELVNSCNQPRNKIKKNEIIT